MTIASTTTGVTSGSTSNDGTIALTFTAGDTTTDFVVGDVTVTNGELSDFSGSGTDYTATLTPSDQGAVTIKVLADKFTDDGGNNNTVSNTFTWTYDSVAPTMLLLVELLILELQVTMELLH